MKEKPTKSFREYGINWREQVAIVKRPMKKHELSDICIQAQEPDYFHYFLETMGKPLVEMINIGEMVENGIKSRKFVSQADLKSTKQAFQNWFIGFGNRKKKYEGSMMASGSRDVQREIHHTYTQVQYGKYDSPQHYYPHQVLITQLNLSSTMFQTLSVCPIYSTPTMADTASTRLPSIATEFSSTLLSLSRDRLCKRTRSKR